ncbi:MAG: hypothetical protein IKO87_01385 [Kiritimatiellae bacterium]|nr:hypothetical protein [Kiritimatiellia bacterium]
MTIDELNRRYGAPGRIVFRTGFAGYPEVVLANKFGTAEIALLGANVLSYRPTGHSPVIFRPEKRDYNRGESLHGGIPSAGLSSASLPSRACLRTASLALCRSRFAAPYILRT